MQISIVIATFNAGKTLRNCLDSIEPQLTNECELIIIDGGSKDDTCDIIRSYGDKVSYTVSEPDKGIYDAWNKGVKAAHGKWIAFIGADDELIPGAINSYLNVISATADIDEYDYICAHNEYVDMNGKLLKLLGDEPKWKVMKKRMVAAHVASLHSKKNLFETIGYYDYEHYHICADYELLMRKKDSLRYISIPDHIARMKVGGVSFSTKAIKETYKIRAQHHSLGPLLNSVHYLLDLIAYKFFVVRKTLGGGNFLSTLLGRVKGGGAVVDSRIPSSYLFRLMVSKMASLLYGMIRLMTFKRVYVHPSATIKCASRIHTGKNFSVAQDCYIDAMSEQGLTCGENVSMGFHTHIELTGSIRCMGKGMKIGNNVGLGTHGHYGSGMGFVEIGDDTIFGNYVSIHPENHVTQDLETPIRLQGVFSKGGVKIGKNCWIGAKVTILDGTKIGDGCVVAAGAVVKGTFPDNCILGGVPAKIIKMRTN